MDRRAFLTVAGVGLVAMKPQSRLPLLKSTINGGRPRGSHPALPTTPEECARTAGAVVAAGAGAVHVHIRDADGAESLAAADLARTLVAMRSAAPGTPIGISTHFRILNDVGRRRDAVAAWTVVPDFASVNFHEEGAVELARQLLEQGVAVEAGLFQADAARVCVESGMAPRCLRLMLEPGGGPLADVAPPPPRRGRQLVGRRRRGGPPRLPDPGRLRGQLPDAGRQHRARQRRDGGGGAPQDPEDRGLAAAPAHRAQRAREARGELVLRHRAQLALQPRIHREARESPTRVSAFPHTALERCTAGPPLARAGQRAPPSCSRASTTCPGELPGHDRDPRPGQRETAGRTQVRGPTRSGCPGGRRDVE
jgi:hypothetical protein